MATNPQPNEQPDYENVEPSTPPMEMPVMPDAIDDPSPMESPGTDGGAMSM